MRTNDNTKKFASRHSWFVKTLAFLTIFATAYTLILPATTLSAKDVYCNLEEHVHSENCEENCPIPEHVHSLQCESNPEADLEDEGSRVASLNGADKVEAGPEKLAAVARSQIGYSPSSQNYSVDENGEMIGYNRYGALNEDPYSKNWESDFILFCLRYGQSPVQLQKTEEFSEWLSSPIIGNQWTEDHRLVQPGDLVLFEQDGRFRAGIADSVGEDAVQVITVAENTVGRVSLNTDAAWKSATCYFNAEEAVSNSDSADSAAQSALQEEAVDPVTAAEEEGEDTSTEPGNTEVSDGGQAESANECGFSKHFPMEKVTAWQLQYKQDGNGWLPYEESTETDPGTVLKHDAQIRLQVNYDKLTKSEIHAANEGKYVFPIPAFLKTTESLAGGNLDHTENGATMVLGHIRQCPSHLNHVHLHYDNYQNLTVELVEDGNFFLYLRTDLEALSKETDPVFRVGDTNIHLKYEEKALENHAEIKDLQKAKNPAGENPNNIRIVDGKVFIDYQIYFTNGGYNLPNVVLDDWFDFNKQLVKGYVPGSIKLQEGTGPAVAVDEGSYCFNKSTENTAEKEWIYTDIHGEEQIHQVPANGMSVYIGDCKANTTYKLTYTVEADTSSLTGGQFTVKNFGQIIVNGVQRNDDYEETPIRADLNVNKTQGNVYKDQQGNALIDYTVAVTAPETNKYVIPAAVLADFVTVRENVTGSDLGGLTERDGNFSFEKVTVTKTVKDGQPVKLDVTADVSATNTEKKFNIPLGSMGPGDSVEVRYTLKIDKNVFAVLADQEKTGINVRNTVRAQTPGGGVIKSGNTTNQWIEQKEWTTKNITNRRTGAETIPVGESPAYDESHQRVEVESFNIPAKSMEYSVDLNPMGLADISNTVFTDTLKASTGTLNDFGYKGYARVEIYKGPIGIEKNRAGEIFVKLPENASSFTFKATDYEYIQNLQNSPLPAGVNLSLRLTYYVSPKSNSVSAVVENSITGNIRFGINGGYKTISTEQKITEWISTNTEITGTKIGVTVLERENEDPRYRYGKVIWMVKINPTVIPAGFKIHDELQKYDDGTSGWSPEHYFLEDSLVGVYATDYDFRNTPFNDFVHKKGNTDKGNVVNYSQYTYKDLEDVLSGNELETVLHLDEKPYSVQYTGAANPKKEMEVTFNQSVDLGNKSMYLLIQSTPKTPLPWPNGENAYGNIFFKNNATYSLGDSTPVDLGNPTMIWRRFCYAKKFAISSFTWRKDTGIVFNTISVTDYKQKYIDAMNLEFPLGNAWLKENAYYNEWGITINHNGHNNADYPLPDGFTGPFEVVEKLPENSRFVKAFITNGGNASINEYFEGETSTKKNQPVRIEKTEISEDGREVRFTVSGIQSVGAPCTIHVITEFTGDWDDLVTHETQNPNPYQLTNTAEVYYNDNKVGQGSVNHDISLGDVLTKDGPEKTEGKASGSKDIEFNIKLNEHAVDLIPGSDTIDLEDTFNERLTIDQSSLRITDGSNHAISGFRIEFSDPDPVSKMTTMTIWGLPDKTHIKISYTALLNANPGDEDIPISNSVSWRGYGRPSSSANYGASYSYNSAGSSSSACENLKIKKVDKNAAQLNIKGAKFSIYRLKDDQKVYNEEKGETQFECILDGNTETKLTTNENGEIILDAKNQSPLAKNTLYMIKEVAVPTPYELYSTPIYLYFESTSLSYTRPALPEGCIIVQSGPLYTLTVQNQKPQCKIRIQKKFDGNTVIPGEYHFAVYKNPLQNPLPNPGSYVKRAVLKIADTDKGNTKELVFDQLDKEGTYYVYELDPDDSQPIAYGTRIELKGNIFTVTGENVVIDTSKEPDEDDATYTVTINNSPAYRLPVTGGMGDMFYILTGSAITGSALVLLLRKRMCKERQ